MKKFTFLLSITLSLFLLAATTASADTTCTPIYGGGQNCVTSGNIGISKTVQNPQSGGFVANLGTNDPKYNPGQSITFQVTVTNNDSAVNSIAVVDTFPQFFKFVSGPGSFNSNNNTLNWTVTSLGVGQSQAFTIQGNIVGASSLPFAQGVTCPVNQVSATANNGDGAQSSSQFCIVNNITPTPTVATTTKGGLPVMTPVPVKVTPPTGPEALPLLALIPGALTGIGLIKKSKKS